MRIVAEGIGAMIMLGVFAYGMTMLVEWFNRRDVKTHETKDKGETK